MKNNFTPFYKTLSSFILTKMDMERFLPPYMEMKVGADKKKKKHQTHSSMEVNRILSNLINLHT